MAEYGGSSSFGTQGVAVTPRHFFGVNATIKNSLYLVQDDNTLLYTAGHNIVMYTLDEKQMTFMPGKRTTFYRLI